MFAIFETARAKSTKTGNSPAFDTLAAAREYVEREYAKVLLFVDEVEDNAFAFATRFGIYEVKAS